MDFAKLPFSDLAIIFGVLVVLGTFVGYVVGFSTFERSECHPNQTDFAYDAAAKGSFWGVVSGFGASTLLLGVAAIQKSF